MKYPDFSRAEIENKVYDIKFGWGKIIDILHNDTYPFLVEFPNYKTKTYTYDGRVYDDAAVPNLWWDEWIIEPPESALKPKQYIYIPNTQINAEPLISKYTQKNDEPKYCCNCKHFGINLLCCRFTKRDLVTGNPTDNVFPARDMRHESCIITDNKTGKHYSVSCGEEAIYFEEKE
ncbi:MAG: hypothetical protein ACOCUT_03440 [bacterium]